MLANIWQNLKNKRPIVHCITNYVTVNDCANILLAGGAAPIMADDIGEVEDITAICSGLYINIGTLNERTIASMTAAGRKANSLSHPVILDPVGAGASPLRTHTVSLLLENILFSAIRGNMSEIKAIVQGNGSTRGVDAEVNDMVTEENIGNAVSFARSLSKKTNAVIAISGAIDIISSGDKTYLVRNGHPLMARITGTGCMLTALMAACCAANPDRILDAAATAACAVGISGELAYEKMQQNDVGISSYRTYFLDAIEKINGEILERRSQIEGC